MLPNRIRQIHELGDTAELWCPPVTRPSLATRGILLAGWSDAGRGYRMCWPKLGHGQLIVCYGGEGRVWVDDAWQPCTEGQAYVSPVGSLTLYETVAGSRWKIAWIQLDRNACRLPGLLRGDRSVVTPVDPHPVRNAIEGLYREGVGRSEPLLMEQWSELTYTYVCRMVLPNAESEIDPLRKVWAAVDARPAAGWSLTELANLAGMSVETLRLQCRRHVRTSPMQQVTRLRMRRADFLIQSTSMKLAVIARMVGYENVFAFSTAFRRAFGVPPSARRTQTDRPTSEDSAAPRGERRGANTD